jgi:hypothetical protein
MAKTKNAVLAAGLAAAVLAFGSVGNLASAAPGKPILLASAGAEYVGPSANRGAYLYKYGTHGYGHYVTAPDGSYGGYPADSGAAQELKQNQHDYCLAVPEQC